jgi:hypothetical protein
MLTSFSDFLCTISLILTTKGELFNLFKEITSGNSRHYYQEAEAPFIFFMATSSPVSEFRALTTDP